MRPLSLVLLEWVVSGTQAARFYRMANRKESTSTTGSARARRQEWQIAAKPAKRAHAAEKTVHTPGDYLANSGKVEGT